jgi:hypothetical protein
MPFDRALVATAAAEVSASSSHLWGVVACGPNAAGLGPHPLRRGESGARFAPRSQHLGKLRAIEECRRRLAARL